MTKYILCCFAINVGWIQSFIARYPRSSLKCINNRRTISLKLTLEFKDFRNIYIIYFPEKVHKEKLFNIKITRLLLYPSHHRDVCLELTYFYNLFLCFTLITLSTKYIIIVELMKFQ